MSPTQTPGDRSAPEAACTAGADPPQIDPATQAYIDQKVAERLATPTATTIAAPPKIKEPEVFDGNRARYLSWKRSLQLYVGGVEKDRAVTMIMSFMRGPHVDHWRDALLKHHHQDGQWSFQTIIDFWAASDKAWIDPNIAQMAQACLEACYQGRRDALAFFQEFEELADLAGFETTEKHVIDILQRNATPWIVFMIYATGHEPQSYDEWKARIEQIDSLWRKGEIILHRNQPAQPAAAAPPCSMLYPPTRSTAGPPLAGPSPPSYPTTRRDGTGILYGGRGQPMDVDRACFACGHKQSERGTCGRRWHEPNRLQKPPKQAKIQDTRNLWDSPEGCRTFEEAIRRYAAEHPDEFAAAGFGCGSA